MLLRGDPFQLLTICGIFQRSIEVFKADHITFFSIGVIGAVPMFFMNWFILTTFADIFDIDEVTDPEEMNKKILKAMAGMLGPFLLAYVLILITSIILKVATIRSTVQVYISQKPVLIKDLKHGLRLLPKILCLSLAFFCGLFAAGFVAGLCIGIITVLLTALFGKSIIVVTFILQLCFQVAILYVVYSLIFWDTALVVEDLPEFRPFFRSYDLVQGQCCFVFCALFLEGLALAAVFLLNHLLFNSLGPFAVAIAQTLVGVVAQPYAGIFLTVLYVNSRIAREECNGTVLAREMDLEDSGLYAALQSEQEVQMETALHKDEVDEPTD